MSLHDIDHMPAAVREVARVLAVGGRPVIAIVHPVNSAGRLTGDKAAADRPFVIDGSYLQPERYVDVINRDGLTVTFHGEHRPLQAYTEALAEAGCVIERLREPASPRPRHALAPRPAVPQRRGRACAIRILLNRRSRADRG
jgi:hypothetical protein